MEESVKIAVRWQPISESNEKKDEIILKKLTKNVSSIACLIASDRIVHRDIVLIANFNLLLLVR